MKETEVWAAKSTLLNTQSRFSEVKVEKMLNLPNLPFKFSSVLGALNCQNWAMNRI